jgi:hypothetical protein
MDPSFIVQRVSSSIAKLWIHANLVVHTLVQVVISLANLYLSSQTININVFLKKLILYMFGYIQAKVCQKNK